MKCSLDANDAVAIAAFWGNDRYLRSAAQRGVPGPARVAVTVQLSPEVVEHFKATGDGWQARMNDVLREYVEQQRPKNLNGGLPDL